MRFFWKKDLEKNEPDEPLRQIWDRDPTAIRRDVATGMPLDLLTPSSMPRSLEPKMDPDKTRVFGDELSGD